MSITPRRHVAVGLLCRAAGLGLGIIADHIVPDPQTHHPVAMFGAAVARLEKTMYADSTRRGTLFTVTCLTPLAVIGGAVDRLTRNRPALRIATTALATWAVVGSASLAREGRAMAGHLANGDLVAARKRLPHLCGRDPDALDAAEIARGAVESMAENASDAAVASLWWGAVAGLPGLLVHRGANTLDAMIGHHNDRYEHFGKVAAYLDDVVNWVPARFTGALAAGCASTVGGDRKLHGEWCGPSMATIPVPTVAGASRPGQRPSVFNSADVTSTTATGWSSAPYWGPGPVPMLTRRPTRRAWSPRSPRQPPGVLSQGWPVWPMCCSAAA